jgi:uncharacterized protein YndB with AHSA1/START domain/predicted enzyme related to lactoylglutathione lyase
MKLQGLRTHALATTDVAATRDWYARLLSHAPYFDEPFYVGFDVAGYELGVFPLTTDGGSAPEAVAYWASKDVAADIERAVAMGAIVIEPAKDVGENIVVGAVRDPFGNAFGFIENRHFAPRMVAAGGTDLRPDPIVIETAVAATPDACFAAWSSSEGLREWWVESSRVDLRVGGHFELYFLTDAPWGSRGSEGCRVLSYLPGRMLSFTWNAPPSLPKTRDQHTWVVLEFERAGEGTRVRLTHTGWPASAWETEPEWAETHAYFQRAWTFVIDRFAEHFGRA